MTDEPLPEVTALLQAWSRGDERARDQLVPYVYRELRRRAAYYLRREQDARTLSPTALVHEAYLRLVRGQPVPWRDRAHFFGIAAHLMRQVLVDHARHRRAAKREGGRVQVPLDEEMALSPPPDVELLALDSALAELAGKDPRQAQMVELRYFGGLSVEETAEVMGLSPATVKRDWRMARAWLHRRIRAGEPPPED